MYLEFMFHVSRMNIMFYRCSGNLIYVLFRIYVLQLFPMFYVVSTNIVRNSVSLVFGTAKWYRKPTDKFLDKLHHIVYWKRGYKCWQIGALVYHLYTSNSDVNCMLNTDEDTEYNHYPWAVYLILIIVFFFLQVIHK